MRAITSIATLILLTACSISPPKGYQSLQKNLAHDPLQTQQEVTQQLKIQNISKPNSQCENANLSHLTLSSSLRIGLCKNPSIRIAWERINQISSTIGKTKSTYWPRLIAHYNANYHKTSLGQLNNPYTDVQNAALELQWTLLDFGQRAADQDSAIALLSAQIAQYNQALQQQWLNISTAYISLVTANNLLDLERKNLENTKENLELVQTLHNAGIVIAADVAQAEVAVKRAELALLTAQGQNANAKGQLAQYIGYPVTTQLSIAPVNKKLKQTQLDNDIETILMQALNAHPDILAAQSHLNSKEAEIISIESKGLPTISLYGKYELKDSFSHTHNRHQQEKVIGLRLQWPLFTGFEHSYSIQQATTEYKAQAFEVERIKQEVVRAIWDNWQQYQTTLKKLEVAKNAIIAAKINTKAQRGRYHAGIGNLSDLLAAQKDLQEVSKAKIQAEHEWYQAKINLIFSIGVDVFKFI